MISISVFLAGFCTMANSKTEKPIIKNSSFSIYPDRVEQNGFVSKAQDASTLLTDYVSTSNFYTSPNLDFKFSINGLDNELNYDLYHHANIAPVGNETVVLDVVFGQPGTHRNYGKSSETLPRNTNVLFRVDMRAVLKSFKEKGYFEDVHGAKIYQSNLEGFYIAGNTAPLDFQFSNIKGYGGRRLQDEDKDGIYEIKLTFNNHNQPNRQERKWNLSKNISKYPALNSTFPLLNSLYNMSLEEMMLNMEEDGTFRTGRSWAGVWTRDVSYSIMLAMGMLEPQIAQNSLMRKVRNNRIIQDTGTGGAWPCSSDRIVWALAAWEIYEYTGDQEWLKKVYEIVANSVTDDEKIVFDNQFGLIRGESSFLDWREQTYPKWMEPADIYASMNLGTNAAYYQVLTVLSKMSKELGVKDSWHQKALVLKQNIIKHLWLDNEKYFAQYIYGRNFKMLSPRSEALGEAFTVLFDIADGKQKKMVLENTPVLDYGIPCIYPQIPNQSSYHNNAIWPFVEAFWTLANAQEKNAAGVEAGIASMMRQSALFLTNKENFVAENGDHEGTMMNSDRQLWSVGGQLAMVYKVLFGIRFRENQMQFNPLIPKSMKGEYTLRQIKFRNGIYHVTIKGFGDAIKSFMLDGQAQTNYAVDGKMTGEHQIVIVMNNKQAKSVIHRVEYASSADMPTVRIEKDLLVWDTIQGAASYKIYQNGVLAGSQTENTFKLADFTEFAEYQVSVINAKGFESFRSKPVTRIAENQKIILDASVFNLPAKKDCDGATGNGYVSLTRANQEILEFSVEVPVSGIYHIYFRYSNGNGPGNSDNKCGVRSLGLNGKYAAPFVFPQRGVAEWSNWGNSNIESVTLKAGKNDFRLQFDPFNENMNGTVNDFILDSIHLEKMD